MGNPIFLSHGHQRLKHHFWRNWFSAKTAGRMFQGELSGFSAAMHHFHSNMWTVNIIALDAENPVSLATTSWESPLMQQQQQLPASKSVIQ